MKMKKILIPLMLVIPAAVVVALKKFPGGAKYFNEMIEKGKRLKNDFAKKINGEKMPAHKEAQAQCKAETTDGSRCSRESQPGSDYCWQHSK